MKFYKSKFLFSSLASIIILNTSLAFAEEDVVDTNNDFANEDTLDVNPTNGFVDGEESYANFLEFYKEGISRGMYFIYYTNKIGFVEYKAIPIPNPSISEDFDTNDRSAMLNLKKDLIDFYILNNYEDYIVDLIDYSYYDFSTVEVSLDESHKKESAELLKHYYDSKKLSTDELKKKIVKSKFFDLPNGTISEEIFPYKNSPFDFSKYSSYFLENRAFSKENKNNKYGPHYMSNDDFDAVAEHPKLAEENDTSTPSISIEEPSIDDDKIKEQLNIDDDQNSDGSFISNNFSLISILLAFSILGLAIFFLFKNKKRKEV